MVHFTSCVTSTSILGTCIMEYAHSNGSSSVSSLSSSSLVSVTPGSALEAYLPDLLTAPTTALCRELALVGGGVFWQWHVQLLTIPQAHKVCEYSLGSWH